MREARRVAATYVRRVAETVVGTGVLGFFFEGGELWQESVSMAKAVCRRMAGRLTEGYGFRV